jgi:hypothetical protein
VGRALQDWVKAAVRAWDSGAARNRSGVWEMACSDGRSVNWGGPPAPDGEFDRRGSLSRYKATPKAGAVRRASDGVVVPVMAVQHNAAGGKDPDFGDACAARGG